MEEKDKEKMLDWEEDERILLLLPWTTVLGKGRPPATRRQLPPFFGHLSLHSGVRGDPGTAGGRKRRGGGKPCGKNVSISLLSAHALSIPPSVTLKPPSPPLLPS